MWLSDLPIIGDKMNALKQITSLSDQFEKNNLAHETPEQVSEHIGSILRSCKIREILADKTISRGEMKEFTALKLTEYEMKYLATGWAYLLKLHPEQFQVMIQKETGMKDVNEIVDLVKIELPGGRKKSLRNIMIESSHEYEAIKNETTAALQKKDNTPPVTSSNTEMKLPPVSPEVLTLKMSETLSKSTKQQLSELVKKRGKDFFQQAEVILNGMTTKERNDVIRILINPIGALAIKVAAKASEEFMKLSPLEKKRLPPVFIQMFNGVDNKSV